MSSHGETGNVTKRQGTAQESLFFLVTPSLLFVSLSSSRWTEGAPIDNSNPSEVINYKLYKR